MFIWYFAYGRNVNVNFLVGRAGKPIAMFRGILPGYKLEFSKVPGPRSGVGYATVVPAAREWVEGALYLMTEEQLAKLDEFEGVPTGHYRHEDVKIWCVEQVRWINAVTYVAVKTNSSLKPDAEYLSHIIEGAKTIGLTRDWLGKLEDMLKEAV